VLTLPVPQPVPLEQLDPCNCPKKKPKKKRKPRTECSRGTYTQTATGLIKHAKEFFDCASGRALKPRPKLKIVT